LKIHQISKVQKALSGSVDFNLEITRAKFEDLCKDLFAMTLKPVEQVLKDSKLDVSKVVMIFLWFVFADKLTVACRWTKWCWWEDQRAFPRCKSCCASFSKTNNFATRSIRMRQLHMVRLCKARWLSGMGGAATRALLLLDVTPLSLGIETEVRGP
jgi:heat shock protein 1/8